MPDLALMVTDVLLAFDHLRHEVTVLANVLRRATTLERAYAEAAGAIADVRERLAGPVPQRRRAAGASRPSSRRTSASDGFADGGRARQGVHPRRRRLPGRARASAGAADCPVDAFSIYRGLRAINPSPYMYFLDFEDFEIAGRLARVARQGRRPARGAAPDRRHAAARAAPTRTSWPTSCSPTRRSAPST